MAVVMTHVVSFKKICKHIIYIKYTTQGHITLEEGWGQTLLYFKIMKWRDCIVDSGIHTSPQQMSNSFCWVNATPLEQTTCRHEILHQLIILLVICLLNTYGYKSVAYLRQWCIVVV